MSIEEIIQLIQAVSENKLTSFELEEGNMKLSLKCKKEQPQIVTVAAASMDQAAVQMLNTAAAAQAFPWPRCRTSRPRQRALTLALIKWSPLPWLEPFTLPPRRMQMHS